MKKTIAVLLLAVAGAGIFYVLQKKQKTIAANSINKELILGKWKLDTLILPSDSKGNDFMTGIMGMIDPDLQKYHYTFSKDNTISLSLHDSLIKDSSRYEWRGIDQLAWKEWPNDTAGTLFRLITLNQDSLRLQSTDSTDMIFLRTEN